MLYKIKGSSGQMRVGYRGKQSVHLIQKVLTLRSKLRKVTKLIGDDLGKLKASFCIGWIPLRIAGMPPEWVWKHVISNRAPGKIQNDLANKERPKFSIISNAPGVNSNFKVVSVIQQSLDRRARLMAADAQFRIRQAKKLAFNK
jgi:hypothetical protein